ncbi:MAG: hypothetical protein COY53_00350 [Elusimicrobia bacterium CG_4_10_14_0_8_um_filter_37_32]|nr:MAG: hypothetical protein COS17_06280 [Elusimicrobia bacterium CG02_land_8_20_14_3_00_37_13]PIZ14347.1 MAG: hypothetical protein COY53_00350 [Elusimicrobia bacterium CG_4_10_14_0_8_um_filter_37_32]
MNINKCGIPACKSSGQTCVETLFAIPLFVLFLVTITFFARIFITWIILTQAARHGVFLIVHANYNENQVKGEIVDYLTTEKHLLNDIRQENIDVHINNFWGPSSVSINYNLTLPRLLYNIPGFPKPFTISARSECYNNSWYYNSQS